MRMCSIASGSSGNCIYIGSNNTHLLVDTGISKKRIEEGLKELEIKGEELNGILVTHEHSDHIQGLGVFSRKYEIPVYATPGTIEGIKSYSMPMNPPVTGWSAVENRRPWPRIWESTRIMWWENFKIWTPCCWRPTMTYICWKWGHILTI